MNMVLETLRTDPAARKAFKADPRGWLARHGVAVPEGRRVVVHENSGTELHIVLPSLAGSGELSEADLALVAGGTSWSKDMESDACQELKNKLEQSDIQAYEAMGLSPKDAAAEVAELYKREHISS